MPKNPSEKEERHNTHEPQHNLPSGAVTIVARPGHRIKTIRGQR